MEGEKSNKSKQDKPAVGAPGKQFQKGNAKKNRSGKHPRKSKVKSKEPLPVCPLCGKVIDSLSQAIGGPGKEEISHFDCVLRMIAENEALGPGQKVSYIGQGNFGVLEFKNPNFTGGFIIKKRIPYETSENMSYVKKYVEARRSR